MEWIGRIVCEIFAFRLYCDLENLGSGSLKVNESGTVRLSTYDFIFVFHSNYASLVPFPRHSRILVENCYTLVFGAHVGGEAVRFTQKPLVTKN